MAYLNVNFYSEVLGMNTAMNVLLPQRTRSMIHDDPDGQNHYPVLFLLHGMSDDYTAWMRYTNIETYAEEKEIAVVMPDGGLSWYADMAQGYNYRKFVGEELVSVVRRMFPGISPKYEDTFITGSSMGGYGALSIGLTYPETFSKIGAIAPGCSPDGFFPGGDLCRVISRSEQFWSDIFGDLTAFKGGKNDLCALAKGIVENKRPMPEIFQIVGTADFFYKCNVKFRDELRGIGVNPTYTEVPEAYHAWHYWDEFIQPILAWLTAKEGQ